MSKNKDRAEEARKAERAAKEKAEADAKAAEADAKAAEAVAISKNRKVIQPGQVPKKDFPTKGLFAKGSFTCGGIVLATGTWINPDSDFLRARGLNEEDLIERKLLIKK